VGGPLTPVDVDILANDTDPNVGDTLTVVRGSVTVPQDAGGVPRGSVAVVDGIVTYTPRAGFSDLVTCSYRVTDGTAQATATVTITVQSAPPVAAPDTARITTGRPTTIDVIGNDTDPDGGALSVLSVTQPAHGSVAIVDNRLVYTPEAGYTGTVTITYLLSDGQGGTATGTVTLDVVAAAAGTATPSGLAATGVQLNMLLAAIVVLVGAGAGLMVAARRRLEA